MAHLPCEHCGSSDAVQPYKDGMFCFSCHKKQYLEVSGSIRNSRIANDAQDVPYPTARNKVIQKLNPCILNQPTMWLLEKNMCNPSYEGRVYNMIKSVDLYSRNKEKWYTITNCLELLIYNLKGEYIGSEYRLFSGDRKSISDYPPGSVFLSNPLEHVPCRVITEDIASAINVSHVCPSLALMGTSLPRRCSQKLLTILESADRFVLWLDGDKPGQEAAKKVAKTISQFKPVQNVVTSLDPKCYQHSEVRDILRGHI